jgi:DNA-directed RNA polymerase II subunit RPB2
MLNKNDIWKVIDAFFREKGLVKHQLDSFDDFINVKIYKIIEELEPLKLSYTAPNGETTHHIISFKNPYVSKPQVIERNNDIIHITPNEARLRSLNYEVTLYLNVQYDQVRFQHPSLCLEGSIQTNNSFSSCLLLESHALIRRVKFFRIFSFKLRSDERQI